MREKRLDQDYERALDEAAANYAGRMIEDGKMLDDFIEKHREDRTLLEKIRDAIRALIAKLTGAERRQAQTAEGKLTQALEAAARAKNKAISGLGELIETAANRRWEKTKHPGSKDAKYGMYRYDSTFAFPVKDSNGETKRVRAYDVELLIRNASDGKKYLYDIVNVRENTTAQIDLTQREAKSAAYKAATGG